VTPVRHFSNMTFALTATDADQRVAAYQTELGSSPSPSLRYFREVTGTVICSALNDLEHISATTRTGPNTCTLPLEVYI
jgi:hypothetical protein